MKNRYIKALGTALLCTLGAALVIITFQTISNNAVEDRLVDRILSEIPKRLDSESESRTALIKDYDLAFHKDLASVKYLMETDGQASFFERMRKENISTGFYLVRKNGTIVNSTDKAGIGKKLGDVCNLSKEDCKLLLESEEAVNTGIRKSEEGDLVKVFAIPYDGFRLVMSSEMKGKYASVYKLDDINGLFGAVDERLMVASIDNSTLRFGSLRTFAGDFTNQPISTINLDESATREPLSGHSKVMGHGYRYKTVQYKSEVLGDLTILALYSDADAVPTGPLFILLATILLVTFLLHLYCQYIDEEPGKLQIRVEGLHPVGKKGCTLDTEKARILLPFSLLSIVAVTFVGCYLNSMNMIANQIWTSRWNIDNVSESLGTLDRNSTTDFNAETEDMASFQKLTSAVLESRQASLLDCRDVTRLKNIRQEDGSVRLVEISNPWLAALAETESADDISIFDEEGKLISTSGTQRNLSLSREDAGVSSIFDVIDGVADRRLLECDDYILLGVPILMLRNDSASDAMLVSRFKKSTQNSFSMLESICNTFDAASESGYCNYMMTSATDDCKVIYVSKELGLEAVPLPKEAYRDGYVGSQKINDKNYFVVSKRISGNRNSYFIFSFVPYSEVFLGRMTGTLTTFAVTLVVILILLAILLVYGPEKTGRLRSMSEKDIEERRSMTAVQLEKLKVDTARAPSASQRIMGAMGKIWLIILFLVTLVLFKGLLTSPTETLAGYLMSFSWQRGVNLFSITTMLIITLSFSFGLFILTKLMSVLGNALNASAETACQLLVSLLRYAGYIVVVFITLYMFGVDTTGVLASLGAFSVMVGLGAKNLITDILAGISIIMEKDYRVGDIINIGGFCGKVTEIGIRTTKVEDIDGNVKIFYNSGVNGVINMTSKPSAVRLDVKIDAQHPFNQVEAAMTGFFERVTGKYPQIKGKCNYLGVQDSTPAFNVYRITIPCDEIDRAPLRRALIKDLSEFCMEEKLNKL